MEPRLVLALLDLDRDHRAMAARLTQAENDAAARLQNTLSLGAMLARGQHRSAGKARPGPARSEMLLRGIQRRS